MTCLKYTIYLVSIEGNAKHDSTSEISPERQRCNVIGSDDLRSQGHCRVVWAFDYWTNEALRPLLVIMFSIWLETQMYLQN